MIIMIKKIMIIKKNICRNLHLYKVVKIWQLYRKTAEVQKC